MKRFFWIYILFIGTLCLQSCEKDTIVYEGEPDDISGIYFLYSSGYTMSGNVQIYHYQDSMEVSFAEVNVNNSVMTVNLPVRILGNLADYDRSFKARVIAGTAVEGVDYKPLDEEYVVPANAAAVVLPLNLLRTDKLKKGKINVTVQLMENENFKLLLPSKVTDDGKTVITTTQIKVIFSEIYTEPFDYLLFGEEIFGPFTVAKFEFINSIMGWSPSSWVDGTEKSGILPYVGRKVQAELQKRADNDDPVYDEDGSFMQLESPYTVNYSKYEKE